MTKPNRMGAALAAASLVAIVTACAGPASSGPRSASILGGKVDSANIGLATKAQLALANAKQQVGAGNILDIRRAEVAVGQAEVAALRARNDVQIERTRLFQQMGVEASPETQLVTEFPIRDPQLRLDSLVQIARGRHPVLAALRERDEASEVAVRQARVPVQVRVRLTRR